VGQQNCRLKKSLDNPLYIYAKLNLINYWFLRAVFLVFYNVYSCTCVLMTVHRLDIVKKMVFSANTFERGFILVLIRNKIWMFLHLCHIQEESMSANDIEVKHLKESLQDTQPVGTLINCCKTLDQASVQYSLSCTQLLIQYECVRVSPSAKSYTSFIETY
jgi:hypothetical protein